jgi:hypothetical protein
VAARRGSQRKAGEHDHLTCVGASVGEGETISILGSVEELAEGGCRRRGEARTAPVRGGSEWGDSGEGDGRSWTGSSWGTRGGGEEALGQRNLGGVVLLGRIPARDVRRRFGVGGRREEERGRNHRRNVLSLVL